MNQNSIKILISFLILFCVTSCENNKSIKMGAERPDKYYPILKDKRVALIANHTAMIEKTHLLDVLIRDGINVTAIFSPEHGFRGDADAGELVASSIDPKTGVPILSLYSGADLAPSKESMEMFDILIFDIQDVGLRFYTYYSTMAILMDACAEYNKEMLVLDRPNPNGHYVDGPIMDMEYKSLVGWLPITTVHGMTLGEIALMTNGEQWLTDGRLCNLTVIEMENYTHQTMYELPIAPSPNLKSMQSIYLYPSTCLFEATIVSEGRGTEYPFEVFGHPDMTGYDFEFTPRSISGAKNPKYLNQKCYGVDLRNISHAEIFTKGIDLSYIIDAYNNLNLGDKFFDNGFEKLIGSSYVREMIKKGRSAEEIKAMWQDDVSKFKQQRKPYLLYQE